MISIVAPAIEAEVSYRHERVTEDFRRARSHRRTRLNGNRGHGQRTKPSAPERHA